MSIELKEEADSPELKNALKINEDIIKI